MLPKIIRIGPLTFHLYGLIIAVAIYCGYLIAKRRSYLYKIPQKLFDDPIILVPLVLAITGARIYHVLDHWDYYSGSLSQVLAIWNGGLGIWGALAGIFLGFWIVTKIRHVDLVTILDLTSPSLLIGQAIGRIGNFINQEAFGPPTNAPWGVFISPENRPSQYQQFTHFHPTFFYEAILDLIFFFILLKFSQRSKVKGQMFALYLIFYSTGRFIAEFWRIDTWTIGIIKIAHVLAIATFIFGAWLFVKLRKIGLDTS